MDDKWRTVRLEKKPKSKIKEDKTETKPKSKIKEDKTETKPIKEKERKK